MNQIVVSRSIEAPIDRVFNTVSDIRNFSEALPHVLRYEFLSDVHSGVGTRFRETRLMKGKEAVTELEVTEYVPNEHVRMVADSHGTAWDTLFSVKREAGHTTLTMTMDARSYKLLPKLLNRLFKGMIMKAVERDMDMVKEYCEDNQSAESALTKE